MIKTETGRRAGFKTSTEVVEIPASRTRRQLVPLVQGQRKHTGAGIFIRCRLFGDGRLLLTQGSGEGHNGGGHVTCRLSQGLPISGAGQVKGAA